RHALHLLRRRHRAGDERAPGRRGCARGLGGAMTRRVVGPAEARRAARRRLPKPVFDYIDGAADDEFTVAENRRAFQDLAFAPRVLARVGERRLDVSVLGQRLALPVLTAP